MPASIKLQREYGDDVAVVFVESQGTSAPDTDRFVMKQRWLGTQAMWTNESPFNSGSGGLPNYVLLGADGKVLQKGRSLSSKDHDLLDAEIKRAKGAPEGTDKAFNGAWKDFNKGKYGKAIVTVQKLSVKKPEMADAAAEVMATFEARVQAQLDRVDWLMKNGYPGDAKDRLDELASGLSGADELLGKARELDGVLASDEMKRELEADKKLGRALESLFEDGRDEKLFDRVTKLSEEFAGTKVAERAQRFASMRP